MNIVKENKINRDELKTLIKEKCGMDKQDADIFIDAFAGVVRDALIEGKTVHIKGFGDFAVRERAARNGVDPRNGKPISIPACKTPSFKASTVLKSALNKGVNEK